MNNTNDDVIHKPTEAKDHNPEARTWFYDDFGNRRDKKTGKFVILIDNSVSTNIKQLLTEKNNPQKKRIPADLEDAYDGTD